MYQRIKPKIKRKRYTNYDKYYSYYDWILGNYITI